MIQWSLRDIFCTLFNILFFGNAQTLWSRNLVRLIRVVILSLLLRTYIAPWLLVLTSKHIRIRSISLRSIKGLYFKRGRWVCRAERIGYVLGTAEGRRGLTLRVDGLKMELQTEVEEDTSPTSRPKHRRNLTLADLHPSPLAGHLWQIVTKVMLLLEPWLRPVIRNAVVGCFCIAIKWLPALTQALSFELHSTVFTLAQVPGTQIIADEINLHAELVLTQVENMAVDARNNARNREIASSSSWTFYGMSTWKRKMSDGLKRALDRAWGTMRGSASISFKLSDVVGSTPKEGQSGVFPNYFTELGI